VSQLALSLGPRPAAPAPAYALAPALLWRGAGRPAPEGAVATDARCWWCAEPSPGLGVPVDTLPDTFADRPLAALPSSAWLCACCAWTMSDRIRLPAELGDAALESRLAAGGRALVGLRGADPERRLVLRLDDGRIGLWSPATPTALEAPWTEAIASLRADPRDVGPCRLLEVVDPSALSTGTARFRNYHHLGTERLWRPVPNSSEGRAAVREWLLHPPAEPWCCVIGDGQKHVAIKTPVAGGPGFVGVVGFVGVEILLPERLGELLGLYEALILAGADDEAIAAWRFDGRSIGQAIAVRRADPLRAYLGSGLIDLLTFIRRTRAALEAA